jgi:hypothetical protein
MVMIVIVVVTLMSTIVIPNIQRTPLEDEDQTQKQCYLFEVCKVHF